MKGEKHMIKILVVAYVVVSIIIGLADVSKIRRQERSLDSFPIGDIGYYVFPKPILGTHNWIFLPSWIPYLLARLYFKVFG